MTKNIVSPLLLAATLLASSFLSAQEIHYTQFNAAPLALNPAFTGMMDGSVRASALYRNQWKSVTVPYTTIGASVDGRMITMHNGDYMGVGAQLFQDQAGDGQLKNFSGTASVAYHTLFGYDSSGKLRGCDLSAGLQGGYAQSSVDLSRLYFQNNPYPFPYPYPGPYYLGIGNEVNYYFINAGLAFSQRIGPRFNYTVGLSASNINQPNDDLLKKQNTITGFDFYVTGTLGINVMVTDRFIIKPAFIFINHSSYTDLLGGSEFLYKVPSKRKNKNAEPAVFLGAWYKSDDILMISAGVEMRSLRIGVAYDYATGKNNIDASTNGNGGFEVMARYIAPGYRSLSKRKPIPCDRF